MALEEVPHLTAYMDVDVIFGNNDRYVNGDILIVSKSGVKYENDARLIVTCLNDTPTAPEPAEFAPLNFTKRQAAAFIGYNAHTITETTPGLALNQAVELAYFRFLAVKYRLVSPQYLPENFRVRYNQCVVLANSSSNNVSANDEHTLPAIRKAELQAAMAAVLTHVNKERYNSIFINLVCMLAYMFRTRGHHYNASMNDKYNDIWRKTASNTVVLLNVWENIMTVGLHAIIPVVLDSFWEVMIKQDKVDPILELRFLSAAAGTALFPVLQKGMSDLLVVFPQAKLLLQNEIEYVEGICLDLKRDRWAHSINATYYGANRGRFDEAKTGAVGALIKAVLDAIVPGTDLTNSEALKRAAKLAPITGSALGVALKSYIKSEAFMNTGGPMDPKMLEYRQ